MVNNKMDDRLDAHGGELARCRTHYKRALLTRVPKSAQSMVATLVRTIFEQPDAASVWAQHTRVVHEADAMTVA